MSTKKLFDKTKHYTHKQDTLLFDIPKEDKFFRVTKQLCNLGKDILKFEKEWGTELVISREPHGCKIMILEPDCQVSAHWHENKSETWVLLEGKMIVETIILATGHKDKIILENKFDSITLPPRVPHTFYCPVGQKESTVFIEASTKDSSHDSYRIFPSQGKDINSGRSDS